MRRMLYALCVGGLLTAPMFSTAAKAQETEKAEAGHHGRMADWMKEKLKLSDVQSKKFDAAWKAHEETFKSLHEQLETAMRKLHGELEIEASDSDIQAALDGMEKAQKAVLAEHDKMKADLDGILTVSQRAQLALMHAKMMSRRHGGMMMHGPMGRHCEGMMEGHHHGHEGMSRGGDDKDQDGKDDRDGDEEMHGD